MEFFHRDHFEFCYHREKAKKNLSQFIDFFWETNFDALFERYPDGFSDALFPNIGYTYLINLGTAFVMQLEGDSFEMRSDGFLPRHKNMVCHHKKGNRIFGIKFKVSPVLFEKKINFSEYREYIFPLAYLIDKKIIEAVKAAPSFKERISVVSGYYEQLVQKHSGSMKPVDVVTGILKECADGKRFDSSIETLAQNYEVSTRTLQRYFEAATSINCKQALQIMRIRSAIEQLTADPAQFHYSDYGYYDYSHFYKHLKSFLNSDTVHILQPHLKLLRGQAAQ